MLVYIRAIQRMYDAMIARYRADKHIPKPPTRMPKGIPILCTYTGVHGHTIYITKSNVVGPHTSTYTNDKDT